MRLRFTIPNENVIKLLYSKNGSKRPKRRPKNGSKRRPEVSGLRFCDLMLIASHLYENTGN